MSFSDVLFAFTEWLRTTQLTEFSLWISETSLSLWIGSHFWAIPVIQTLHILAIAAAFGSVVMINLRIVGLTGKRNTITQTARRYLPWIWWGLLVLVVTGIGMVIGEPVRELINPIFWIKMALIVALILFSLWFQATVRRNMAQWELTHDGRVAIRVGAIGIIALWCLVMVCGRWIAYAPV